MPTASEVDQVRQEARRALNRLRGLGYPPGDLATTSAMTEAEQLLASALLALRRAVHRLPGDV
jgi:selenocysteine lyase/cysteine desulfurase